MFTAGDLLNLAQGSVGLIKDEDGKPVQAFIRKQYSIESSPQVVLTKSGGFIDDLLDGADEETNALWILTDSEPRHLVTYKHDDLEDWLDDAEVRLANLPPGSVVLSGDTTTRHSTFTLGLKTEEGWHLSGCTYTQVKGFAAATAARYEDNNLDQYGDTEQMPFQGSLQVFPYSIDTRIAPGGSSPVVMSAEA